ncbi:hypothetical protein Ct9H90mP29_22040 [bacterium]|nr:MAG: hypothetical protein Ct9H90mP29_22040 [bacterium]
MGFLNLHKAGLQHITTDMLETHYLAGGNVQNIVAALIAAEKANIQLPFETATAIDLRDGILMKQFKLCLS